MITPELTMNVYAPARNERLASIVDLIGKEMLQETECALCVHSQDDELTKFTQNPFGSGDQASFEPDIIVDRRIQDI